MSAWQFGYTPLDAAVQRLLGIDRRFRRLPHAIRTDKEATHV
jgi:hypothetical protein